MICNTRSPTGYKPVTPKQEESVESNGNNDLERDPFEDLFDELLYHIMSFLPTIKNIAQLSILSHRWRHLWSTYPYLDFFEVKAPATLQQLPNRQAYTKSIIQSSFSRRPLCDSGTSHSSAPLKICTFYLRGYLCFNGIHQCIWNALMHNVEDFKLQVSFAGSYDLPVELFTCKAMQSLELRIIPEWNPSSSVYGSVMFPSLDMKASLDEVIVPGLQSQLRTLILDQVTFPSLDQVTFLSPFASNIGLSPVIFFFKASLFPYLTRLILSKCEGVDVLEVNCPNLVNLGINQTEMKKLILKTPQLLTLQVLHCFTEENEGVTLVDIWAPKLRVFHWRDNLVPSSFYISDPTHVIDPEVSLLSLDFDEGRVESATNLVSVFCMTAAFRIGDHFLMLLAKLDFYGIHTRRMRLLELYMKTAMTKKSILGIWFLLRMCQDLRFLYVHIAGHSNAEDNNNWGREMLDNHNISEEGFWELQYKYEAPILKKLVWAKIEIRKDGENSDICLVSFLLQRCKGLKYLQVIICQTVSNESFINRLRALTGSLENASPDVQVLVDYG